MEKIALPDELGNSLLFHAVFHGNVKEAIVLLEEKEANINAQNINGSTPLHTAVSVQNPVILEMLLQYNANPNISEYNDVGKCTPLHRAVQLNNIEICQLLLDYGANPSIQALNGFTSLHFAARHGFKEIAELLLASGVDVNLRDVNGFNASYWAKENNHKELLAMLPAIQSIKPKDLLEFHKQFREIHGVTVKIKGRKKGKKKKKK